MAQEGKIGLTIDRTIWKKLSKIKIDKDFKTFNDVLIYLLKSCSTKRKVSELKSSKARSDNIR